MNGGKLVPLINRLARGGVAASQFAPFLCRAGGGGLQGRRRHHPGSHWTPHRPLVPHPGQLRRRRRREEGGEGVEKKEEKEEGKGEEMEILETKTGS